MKRLQSTRRSFPYLELAFWRCFQLATLLVVWREHGKVLRAGGYSWNTFCRECVRLLIEVSHDGFEARAEKEQVLAAEITNFLH